MSKHPIFGSNLQQLMSTDSLLTRFVHSLILKPLLHEAKKITKRELSRQTPDCNATLKAENHALHCTTAGPYNAITSSLLQVGSICALGPDLIGIHSISLAARYRHAACSSTLRRGLEKVNEARGHNCTPLFALSPAWEHDFLFASMTFHTANAFDIVCRLDRDDTLDEVSENKKKEVATGLLLDKLRTQDFAGPLSSRVLSPISRHRIADIQPHMKRVSCASRP